MRDEHGIGQRHEHLDVLGVVAIVGCCFLWGLQQVAVKAILADVPPLLQGGLRSIGASVLVWAWARYRGIRLFAPNGTYGASLAAGVLFSAEFLCIYLALPHTNASRLVVFLYLAPFVVALTVPLFVPTEALDRVQIAGLVFAFVALAYAFQEGLSLPDHGQLLGDAMAVTAAVLWGLTTLVVRVTRLSACTPERTLFYQLFVSAILLTLASWMRGEPWVVPVRPFAWACLGFQTVIVAFASYLVWFWLLRHYSATKVSVFSFLTPMFGLIFGSLLLGEGLSPRIILAFCCVTVGIFLVNRRRR